VRLTVLQRHVPQPPRSRPLSPYRALFRATRAPTATTRSTRRPWRRRGRAPSRTRSWGFASTIRRRIVDANPHDLVLDGARPRLRHGLLVLLVVAVGARVARKSAL